MIERSVDNGDALTLGYLLIYKMYIGIELIMRPTHHKWVKSEAYNIKMNWLKVFQSLFV